MCKGGSRVEAEMQGFKWYMDSYMGSQYSNFYSKHNCFEGANNWSARYIFTDVSREDMTLPKFSLVRSSIIPSGIRFWAGTKYSILDFEGSIEGIKVSLGRLKTVDDNKAVKNVFHELNNEKNLFKSKLSGLRELEKSLSS